jgi:hypothetical protein
MYCSAESPLIKEPVHGYAIAAEGKLLNSRIIPALDEAPVML